MITFWAVIIWTLLICTTSTISFWVIYRKLNPSPIARLANLEQAEAELLFELRQIDLADLEQTNAGKQLLKLLTLENPKLLIEAHARDERLHQVSSSSINLGDSVHKEKSSHISDNELLLASDILQGGLDQP